MLLFGLVPFRAPLSPQPKVVLRLAIAPHLLPAGRLHRWRWCRRRPLPLPLCLTAPSAIGTLCLVLLGCDSAGCCCCSSCLHTQLVRFSFHSLPVLLLVIAQCACLRLSRCFLLCLEGAHSLEPFDRCLLGALVLCFDHCYHEPLLDCPVLALLVARFISALWLQCVVCLPLYCLEPMRALYLSAGYDAPLVQVMRMTSGRRVLVLPLLSPCCLPWCHDFIDVHLRHLHRLPALPSLACQERSCHPMKAPEVLQNLLLFCNL